MKVFPKAKIHDRISSRYTIFQIIKNSKFSGSNVLERGIKSTDK